MFDDLSFLPTTTKPVQENKSMAHKQRLKDVDEMRALVHKVKTHAEENKLTIEDACRALDVSPSNYYHYRKASLEDAIGNQSEPVSEDTTETESLEELGVDQIVTQLMGQTKIETVLDRWISVSQNLMSEDATDAAQMAGRLIDEMAYEVQNALELVEAE